MVDLDLLSPLVQRAKFVLMGKSRGYVVDVEVLARAILELAEERAQELDAPLRAENVLLKAENVRLFAENARLVDQYAELLVQTGGSSPALQRE